jgi:hypothetical protein
MSELARWSSYAACWPAPPDQRGPLLAANVTKTVVYRDPGAEVTGIDALAGYMETFRNGFPGMRFVIDRVDAHHARSLAQWRQVDGDGATVGLGISTARHSDDGRLADITGFFLDGP